VVGSQLRFRLLSLTLPFKQNYKKEIELINCDLFGLFERDKNELLTDEQSKELKVKKNLKKELQKQLKRDKEDQK
jgi:hypothetical protein